MGARELPEKYHPTCELLYSLELLDGVPHGIEQTWHVPGVLTIRAHFQAGLLNGSYESWWNNGSIKERGQYHLGKRVGTYYWFRQTGELRSQQDCGGAA